MRLLITGNLGYIGTELTSYLKKKYKKYYVVGYDTGFFKKNLIKSNKHSYSSRVDYQINKDIRKLNKQDLNDIDAVIHLAALSNDTIGKKYHRPGIIPIIETIKHVYNCKKLFSPLGTQLVLNSLFVKNLKLIFEMVPEGYYGFTTAQLVSMFKNSKYKRSITHNVKPGWPLYTNQKVNIEDLKKKIRL